MNNWPLAHHLLWWSGQVDHCCLGSWQHLLTSSSFCTALLFAQVDCFFRAYGDCCFLMMAMVLHRGKLLFLFFFFFCSHSFSCCFFHLDWWWHHHEKSPSKVDCFLFFMMTIQSAWWRHNLGTWGESTVFAQANCCFSFLLLAFWSPLKLGEAIQG